MTDVHHLVPAKFNSTLHSPSLMQLSAESATDLITKHSAGDTILTTDNRRPLKLRRVENNSEKTRQRVGGEVRRVSRIPVLTRPTATTAGDVVGRKQRAVKNEINKPGRKYVPIKRERSPSPVFIRGASPPVPALAKRLDRHQPRDDPLISVHDPPPSHSPPVPALAKKLAHNMSHDDYVTYKKMGVSVRDSPLRNTVIPPKSPPVPALAKSLLAHDTSKSSTNVPSHSVNDDVISNDHTHSSDVQFPINRPPSCSLVVVPIPSLHSTPITKETSDKRNCFQLAPSTSRQNLILQELATLREVYFNEGNKCLCQRYFVIIIVESEFEFYTMSHIHRVFSLSGLQWTTELIEYCQEKNVLFKKLMLKLFIMFDVVFRCLIISKMNGIEYAIQ